MMHRAYTISPASPGARLPSPACETRRAKPAVMQGHDHPRHARGTISTPRGVRPIQTHRNCMSSLLEPSRRRGLFPVPLPATGQDRFVGPRIAVAAGHELARLARGAWHFSARVHHPDSLARTEPVGSGCDHLYIIGMNTNESDHRHLPDQIAEAPWDYHRPVMVDEVLWALAPAPGRTILDGTLGGGGHAKSDFGKRGQNHWVGPRWGCNWVLHTTFSRIRCRQCQACARANFRSLGACFGPTSISLKWTAFC